MIGEKIEKAFDYYNVNKQVSVKIAGEKLKEVTSNYIHEATERLEKLYAKMGELRTEIGCEPCMDYTGWRADVLMANGVENIKRYPYSYEEQDIKEDYNGTPSTNGNEDKKTFYNDMLSAYTELIVEALKAKVLYAAIKENDIYEFSINEAVEMGIDVNDIEKNK